MRLLMLLLLLRFHILDWFTARILLKHNCLTNTSQFQWDWNLLQRFVIVSRVIWSNFPENAANHRTKRFFYLFFYFSLLWLRVACVCFCVLWAPLPYSTVRFLVANTMHRGVDALSFLLTVHFRFYASMRCKISVFVRSLLLLSVSVHAILGAFHFRRTITVCASPVSSQNALPQLDKRQKTFQTRTFIFSLFKWMAGARA